MNEAIVSEGIVAGRIKRTLVEALAPLSLEVIDESAKHAHHAHVVSRAGSAEGNGRDALPHQGGLGRVPRQEPARAPPRDQRACSPTS